MCFRQVSCFSRPCWESFTLFYDNDIHDIELLWPSLHYAVPGCCRPSWQRRQASLQSATQSLNTGALELKTGVTVLQSSSVGHLQGASIRDTETHEEEGRAIQRKHHQFVKSVSCHGILLLWGRMEQSNEINISNTTTLAKSGNVSSLIQHDPKQSISSLNGCYRGLKILGHS